MIANLRGYGSSISFGSKDDEERYAQEVKAALKTQSTRFAVAPRMSVTLPSGKVLGAGEPIAAAMLHGSTQPAWAVLAAHINAGRVLEADGALDDALETARK